jgi:drug/metabolite transporter (DMT)-like permease
LKGSFLTPYIAILIGIISISSAAILVKLAHDAPASIIATYRLLFATLLMTPFLFSSNKKAELKSIGKRDWILSSISGICLAFHFIFWFESLKLTSITSSVVLVSLQPLFAFIGAYFLFKESIKPSIILYIFIAIGGSIIISWGDIQVSGKALIGDVLALLGAVMMTGYLLIGQMVRKRLSATTYTYSVYGVSSITLILYNFILQKPFISYPVKYWIIFLALAILPTFLGHSLFNWALKWVSTSTISMAMLFEPVGASLLAWVFFQETITWTQVIGGSMIIISLILFILRTSNNK